MDRIRTPSRSPAGTALAVVLATAAGLSIAWIDKRSDEVVVAVVPLLIAGGLLGLARPAHPWRWGLLLGGWIPVAYWTGLFGVATTPPNTPFDGLLALIPPTLAAYAGSLVERGLVANAPAATTAREDP